MNKYNVIWSPTFKRELENIYFYIFFSLASPNVAKKFRLKIIQILTHLSYFPNRYSKINETSSLRKFSIHNFVVVYEVNEFSHEVYILHIFHGSQDYLNKL